MSEFYKRASLVKRVSFKSGEKDPVRVELKFSTSSTEIVGLRVNQSKATENQELAISLTHREGGTILFENSDKANWVCEGEFNKFIDIKLPTDREYILTVSPIEEAPLTQDSLLKFEFYYDKIHSGWKKHENQTCLN